MYNIGVIYLLVTVWIIYTLVCLKILVSELLGEYILRRDAVQQR